MWFIELALQNPKSHTQSHENLRGVVHFQMRVNHETNTTTITLMDHSNYFVALTGLFIVHRGFLTTGGHWKYPTKSSLQADSWMSGVLCSKQPIWHTDSQAQPTQKQVTRRSRACEMLKCNCWQGSLASVRKNVVWMLCLFLQLLVTPV